MKINNYLKLFIVFFILSLFVSIKDNLFQNYSVLFMPKEYKTIKKLVDKMAAKNYLGDKEIPFFIGSGTYMEVRAKELGLCKEEDCWYYNNLSPYKKYKNVQGVNINELVKQSYLFNGIEAYAWKGIVWLSKSTFRTYGDRKDWLSCTIGHELSHIVFNDHIEQEIKLIEKLDELKIKDLEKIEEKEELLDLQINRESEKIADNNAAKMIINTGYPKQTCLEELTFLTTSLKLPVDTKNDFSHPGYQERFNSLNKFIDNYDKEKYLKSFKPYKWKWSYDRKNKILKFKPLSPQVVPNKFSL